MQFNHFYGHIDIPILVVKNNESMSVVYENLNACLLFNPLSKEDWQNYDDNTSVNDILKMKQEDFQEFCKKIQKEKNISDYDVNITVYSGKIIPVTLSASKLAEVPEEYILVCIYTVKEQIAQTHTEALLSALHKAYKAESTEAAIHKILAFTGQYTNVSRAYIFEPVSKTHISNTYEWCASGIEPAIQDLKDLPKDDLFYEIIINKGAAITDDVHKLAPEVSILLEPQGIKSIAVIPITRNYRALGCIGLDDCISYRKWSQGEVQFLKEIAGMLSSLLVRRDAERSLNYSLNILNIVTDSLDNIVLVEDILTHTLLFANGAMARIVGIPQKELEGLTREYVLNKFAPNAGDFQPLKEMLGADGEILNKNYSYEFKNSKSGRWYLVRNAIIKWIDGRDVHLETAIDITHQKEHEAELEYVASIDRMTGTYNRAHGHKVLQCILKNKASSQVNSLVFIDLDNLKSINDEFGHAAGDQMILQTVEVIKSGIRKSDTLCRWGGDEFIIILRTDGVQAHKILTKILGVLDRTNKSGENPFKLSFSYGITEINPNKEANVDSLLSKADKNMYTYKMSQRNTGVDYEQ